MKMIAMNANALISMVGVALTFGITACTQSIDSPSLSAPFEERLSFAFQQFEKDEVSVIVGFARKDEELELREFGVLADDGIHPAETQVVIGSISKTVTAVVAAKLVEQGKVRFDETLAEIFPKVPTDKADITLHQLLTHTSGLRRNVGNDGEPLEKDAFLQRLFDSWLVARPGETFEYSNAGFGLVAAITEERSGMSYEQYLENDVLAELGLENTGYMSIYDESRSIRSIDGGDILNANWGGHRPYWNLIGNGGLVSTVPEMIEFRRAVTSGKVISAGTLALMQTPHVAQNDDGSSHYGYGIGILDAGDLGQAYTHDGGNPVFAAMWGDLGGDVAFAAGLNTRKNNAIDVLFDLGKYLYGL